MDVEGYLARLGLPRPPAPTVEALCRLHAAHVERVPYETFDLYLRRPPGLDPAVAAGRIVGGRGGFCYHLNGGFALLLTALGFTVTRHRAGVQVDRAGTPLVDGNHLALTVSGLPAADHPDGVWLVDVGLGDAFHEPVPLRAGRVRQGPFTYGLRPSEVAPGGWRFDHDALGSFAGFDMAPGPAGADAFAAMGHHLSTSPESPFVRLALAQRRDRDGVDILRGCVLTRVDGAGKRSRVVSSAPEWFRILRDRFGLAFHEYDESTRVRMWRRVRRQHRQRSGRRRGRP